MWAPLLRSVDSVYQSLSVRFYLELSFAATWFVEGVVDGYTSDTSSASGSYGGDGPSGEAFCDEEEDAAREAARALRNAEADEKMKLEFAARAAALRAAHLERRKEEKGTSADSFSAGVSGATLATLNASGTRAQALSDPRSFCELCLDAPVAVICGCYRSQLLVCSFCDWYHHFYFMGGAANCTGRFALRGVMDGSGVTVQCCAPLPQNDLVVPSPPAPLGGPAARPQQLRPVGPKHAAPTVPMATKQLLWARYHTLVHPPPAPAGAAAAPTAPAALAPAPLSARAHARVPLPVAPRPCSLCGALLRQPLDLGVTVNLYSKQHGRHDAALAASSMCSSCCEMGPNAGDLVAGSAIPFTAGRARSYVLRPDVHDLTVDSAARSRGTVTGGEAARLFSFPRHQLLPSKRPDKASMSSILNAVSFAQLFGIGALSGNDLLKCMLCGAMPKRLYCDGCYAWYNYKSKGHDVEWNVPSSTLLPKALWKRFETVYSEVSPKSGAGPRLCGEHAITAAAETGRLGGAEVLNTSGMFGAVCEHSVMHLHLHMSGHEQQVHHFLAVMLLAAQERGTMFSDVACFVHGLITRIHASGRGGGGVIAKLLHAFYGKSYRDARLVPSEAPAGSIKSPLGICIPAVADGALVIDNLLPAGFPSLPELQAASDEEALSLITFCIPGLHHYMHTICRPRFGAFSAPTVAGKAVEACESFFSLIASQAPSFTSLPPAVHALKVQAALAGVRDSMIDKAPATALKRYVDGRADLFECRCALDLALLRAGLPARTAPDFDSTMAKESLADIKRQEARRALESRTTRVVEAFEKRVALEEELSALEAVLAASHYRGAPGAPPPSNTHVTRFLVARAGNKLVRSMRDAKTLLGALGVAATLRARVAKLAGSTDATSNQFMRSLVASLVDTAALRDGISRRIDSARGKSASTVALKQQYGQAVELVKARGDALVRLCGLRDGDRGMSEFSKELDEAIKKVAPGKLDVVILQRAPDCLHLVDAPTLKSDAAAKWRAWVGAARELAGRKGEAAQALTGARAALASLRVRLAATSGVVDLTAAAGGADVSPFIAPGTPAVAVGAARPLITLGLQRDMALQEVTRVALGLRACIALGIQRYEELEQQLGRCVTAISLVEQQDPDAFCVPPTDARGSNQQRSRISGLVRGDITPAAWCALRGSVQVAAAAAAGDDDSGSDCSSYDTDVSSVDSHHDEATANVDSLAESSVEEAVEPVEPTARRKRKGFFPAPRAAAPRTTAAAPRAAAPTPAPSRTSLRVAAALPLPISGTADSLFKTMTLFGYTLETVTSALKTVQAFHDLDPDISRQHLRNPEWRSIICNRSLLDQVVYDFCKKCVLVSYQSWGLFDALLLECIVDNRTNHRRAAEQASDVPVNIANDRYLFPSHCPGHYVLVITNNSAVPPTMSLYDPYYGGEKGFYTTWCRSAAPKLQKWINKARETGHLAPLDYTIEFIKGSIAPLQSDSTSCGAFVAAYVYFLTVLGRAPTNKDYNGPDSEALRLVMVDTFLVKRLKRNKPAYGGVDATAINL